MLRFIVNRWWACVLTLVLVVCSSVAVHAQTRGVAPSAFVTNGDGDGGNSSNPPTVGDPDIPTKTKGWYGGWVVGPMPATQRSVGDGSEASGVWTMRLGALLQIVRVRYLGF